MAGAKCSSSQTISGTIVTFLQLNYCHIPCACILLYLLPLQGEDVSVGIWLSAVGPNFVNVGLLCPNQLQTPTLSTLGVYFVISLIDTQCVPMCMHIYHWILADNHLSVLPFVCPSTYLFVCLFVCLSVVHLSIRPFA